MRIDTHVHIVPPFWADALNAVSYFGGQSVPDWSPESALVAMDEMKVDLGVVSVSRPGVSLAVDRNAAVDMARRLNDYSAQLVADYPSRFRFFATLPLPDIESSLAEIDRVVNGLGAEGFTLFTNYEDVYLGDPAFDPVLEELAKHGSVAFVHPTAPNLEWIDGIPPFAVDFLLDTTRAAINLVRHGATTRFPDLKFILSHAGGYIPYAAHRAASLAVAPDGSPLDRGEFIAGLQSFWYDTALSGTDVPIDALLKFVGSERVLFGTDWPYAPRGTSHYFTEQFDALNLEGQVRRAIEHENAERLLGGLQ